MSASTSTAAVMAADSLDLLGGWQLTLLWICVAGGVVVCAAILLVTLRHQRLKGDGHPAAGAPSRASGRGQPGRPTGAQPVSRFARAQALLMEAIWVMVPLLIVLGLGAWVVASHLGYPL